MPETVLFTKLTQDATISAALGTRVYPQYAEQEDEYPFIVYERVNTDRVQSLEAPSGMAEALFEVEIFSKDFDELRSLGQALRLAIDGFRGTVGSVEVADIRLVDEGGNFQDVGDGSEELVRNKAFLVRIWHKEVLP